MKAYPILLALALITSALSLSIHLTHDESPPTPIPFSVEDELATIAEQLSALRSDLTAKIEKQDQEAGSEAENSRRVVVEPTADRLDLDFQGKVIEALARVERRLGLLEQTNANHEIIMDAAELSKTNAPQNVVELRRLGGSSPQETQNRLSSKTVQDVQTYLGSPTVSYVSDDGVLTWHYKLVSSDNVLIMSLYVKFLAGTVVSTRLRLGPAFSR